MRLALHRQAVAAAVQAKWLPNNLLNNIHIYTCNYIYIIAGQHKSHVVAGMKKAFDVFSICFQHDTSALLLGCCSLLKPESNQPVAVRMEGLLSEPSTALICLPLCHHCSFAAQSFTCTFANQSQLLSSHNRKRRLQVTMGNQH